MNTVTSPRNPVLKDVRRAATQGTLTAEGFCVAESFHLLEEALRSNCEIDTVFVAETVRTAVASHVRGLQSVRVVVLDAALFRSISSTDTTQGVIALVRPPVWTLDQVLRGNALVTILDGVQDPGNAGAMLRATEAFGGTGAIFLKGTVNAYNPKCLRGSAGSIFRVPLVTGAEESLVLAALEQRRISIFALMPSAGVAISDCDFTANCALIIGSEGHGVNATLRGKALDARVPTIRVESLNAALAAGVALYEARRQRMRQ